MKKKLLSVVLAGAMIASLSACGGSGDSQSADTTAAPTAAESKAEESPAAGEAEKTETAGAELPSFEGQKLGVCPIYINAGTPSICRTTN